ncbi:hypothetical protein [Sediminitomix flava]|uniref:Tissue inhibitor of metalloproteinase n=1 Tax=Sediminitomix flava TaxID=379075 RepID=A0A315YUQ9_SEDFL|nr:hypothetical protein [Sediminitomix flava]PWJ32905.1 hypothetical protein BC781_1174 [Sediminitomix flava]
MAKIGFIISLYLCLFLKSYCDCKWIENLSEAQEFHRNNSKLIFIGEVVELNDDNTFKLKIVETFKGTEYDFLIGNVTSSCSIKPSEIGIKWLCYVDEPDSNGFISLLDCGLTRSFKEPSLMLKGSVAPPPLKTNSELELKIISTEYYLKNLRILNDEIEQLRKLNLKK